MPKPPLSDKRISAEVPTRPHARRGADSVKGWLERSGPLGASIADQAGRQARWRGWLATRLSGELRARITGVVERDGDLVLYAESAGWCVRLRYALAELEAELRAAHPSIERVSVRVLPAKPSC